MEMKKYRNEYKVTERDMEAIAVYMDDEKREKVHFEFAPCDPETFLAEYCKLDPEFVTVLSQEFSLEF